MERVSWDLAEEKDIALLLEEIERGVPITLVSIFSNLNLNGIIFRNIRNINVWESLKGELDLASFPDLEKIQFFNFHKGLTVKNGDQCKKLSWVYCNKYNPKCGDLSALSQFSCLEEIRIDRTNLKSLKGIEVFVNSNRIEISNARNLMEIDALIGLCKAHKNGELSLVIENGQHINWTPLLNLNESLHNLKYLGIYNLNDLPNLNFIANFKDLKRLGIGPTNIENGDLSPGDHLEYFYFDNRKHYNRKCVND